MHTEVGTYFLILYLIKTGYDFVSPWATSLSTLFRVLVTFSIAKQPEVMIINNLVLQQYFSAIFYVFIQFLIKFADKML